jgi:hypothetical protein
LVVTAVEDAGWLFVVVEAVAAAAALVTFACLSFGPGSPHRKAKTTMAAAMTPDVLM